MHHTVHREILSAVPSNRTDHATTPDLHSASTSSDSSNSLRCPITQEIFVRPVLAEDGYTYEEDPIKQWIEQHGTSPMTRQHLTIAGLRPNRAISDAVEEFRRRRNHRSNRPSSTRAITLSFQYELNVDVRQIGTFPFAQTMGKSLFHAEWIRPRTADERLILLYITDDRADREAQLNVRLLPHPHIVRTLGLVKHDGEGRLLLQEYAARGSLLDLLRTERYPPTSQVIHNIILQIVEALIFLNEQGIVHGGLACCNVLVFAYHATDPSRSLVKLTDFGISRRSNAATSLDIVAILSAAPEVLHSKTYSEKSDVWAFAVLAWEIFSKGSTPMIRQATGDFTENDRRILAGERLLRPTACSSAHWVVFLECMRKNPDHRPTFLQLKQKLLQLQRSMSIEIQEKDD